ncbi:hypothetical protein, partial [Streptomyces rhizosphaericus]|uniref:hypothetical protein n=1 Tax=Streptomyces rhizosphaericus TaxID=114699 RepID=UPI0031D2E405
MPDEPTGHGHDPQAGHQLGCTWLSQASSCLEVVKVSTGGTSGDSDQRRIRSRFLPNDLKCHLTIESFPSICRKVSVLPLHRGDFVTAPM